MKKNNSKVVKGFSFIELILTISLVAMVSGLILVSFNSLNNRQTLDKQIDFIESAINKTRNDALNSRNDTDQTFTFATTSITYDGKTINLDASVMLSSYTTGVKSIVFSRLSGIPNATGTLVYKLQKGSTVISTSSIIINNLGIIE
ncbi:hypothetical protein H7Y21_03640 [Arenimonas sp.]|nr:hypothetical protein [Candidatus Parcubacteria bacterium]